MWPVLKFSPLLASVVPVAFHSTPPSHFYSFVHLSSSIQALNCYILGLCFLTLVDSFWLISSSNALVLISDQFHLTSPKISSVAYYTAPMRPLLGTSHSISKTKLIIHPPRSVPPTGFVVSFNSVAHTINPGMNVNSTSSHPTLSSPPLLLPVNLPLPCSHSDYSPSRPPQVLPCTAISFPYLFPDHQPYWTQGTLSQHFSLCYVISPLKIPQWLHVSWELNSKSLRMIFKALQPLILSTCHPLSPAIPSWTLWAPAHTHSLLCLGCHVFPYTAPSAPEQPFQHHLPTVNKLPSHDSSPNSFILTNSRKKRK